jgi:hypothetical protein
MKLQSANQSRNEMFNEFDRWITSTLVEIKDTAKYREELANTQLLLELIGNKTNEFSKLSLLDAATIVNAVLEASNPKLENERISIIDNAASLLFLVTGKSDNNAKCQFPLFLRDVSHWDELPYRLGKRLSRKPIPRVLKSAQLSAQIAKLKPDIDIQKQFFTEYVKFILDSPEYIKSLWAIGNSYYRMKQISLHEEFLMPLVIFKVRGSVSASGGHDPEDLLRRIMASWGMVAGTDFNTNDVIIQGKPSNYKSKTRAFDFVLPYKVPNWKNRIFIQCQFYAGDSGSVSHKNVDQTRSSRNFTKSVLLNQEPIFLEYLDGAGYYSSLNGDLRSILSMEDTHDFFQVRTAPLKLRRALQEIGFLTPLELVHALALHQFNLTDAQKYLEQDGYSKEEINRVTTSGYAQNLFSQHRNQISVKTNFISTCRQYYLLDVIFNNAIPLDATLMQKGVILVPGLNGICGILLSALSELIEKTGGEFTYYYKLSANLREDLGILSINGWIIQM